MSWIAIGSTVVSVGGSVLAGSQAASAQRKASNANLQQARETNELNERLWRESRGSEGSALLPVYLSDYERALGSGAAELAQLGMGNVRGRSGAIQTDIDRMSPIFDASTGRIADLFSGAMLNNRLGALAPVASARTAAAKSRFDTISQSLDETIGRLNALHARRGFLGGSSFDNNQLMGATLGTRQAAADALAAARLQNAQDEASIRDQDALMQVQSVGLPFEQAQRYATLREMPMTAVASGAQQALAPLNFFRMGQSTWQAAPMPQVQPTMSGGQILGQGIGALGSSLGNYFAMQNLARQYGQMGGVPGVPTYAMPQASPTMVPMTNADYTRYSNVPAYVLPASTASSGSMFMG